MSQEKMLKTLKNLGLTQPDAQVYVFLGKRGPQKVRDMAKALRLSKQTVYRAIENLQRKGMALATLEHPARFSAVPFEKVLDLFVKDKTEEVSRIEQDKESLLFDWQSIALAESVDRSPRFTVMEGRKTVYSRLKQMIEDAKNQLSIVITVPGLVRVDQFGLLDVAFKQARSKGMKVRFLTDLSSENAKAMKMLLEKTPNGSSFEGRAPELGLKLISRMLIRDDAEAAFFVSQESNKTSQESDELCLWTNSKPIVDSFKVVFEDLWHNSTDINKRIAEIETGQQIPKTYTINDPEEAKKKLEDAVDAAKKEIVFMTSATGLIEINEDFVKLRRRALEGVLVKIMAPITRGNLETALTFSEYCKVRHTSATYLETAIIDEKYLFQFRQPPSELKQDLDSRFERAFYTTDHDYIDKIHSMLDEVWRNAVAPSAVTVEEITKPSMPTTAPVPDDEYTVSRKDSPYQKMVIRIDEKPRLVTEEHILNKIINAKRSRVKDPGKDPAVYFGSVASAVIHPPSSFNLPDMLLQFFHLNKQSSWGAEDYFAVYLWLDTPRGKAFVPVALAGDSPRGLQHRRLSYGGTPASQNFHVLRKNELQIQVHGNTLFAGWTVPIPLFPPQYTLPPAAVLFEGYGKLKPEMLNVTMPSGWTVFMESNGLDAFVTFFHPASKYAGPGTDATLGRDMTYTVYHPSVPPSWLR